MPNLNFIKSVEIPGLNYYIKDNKSIWSKVNNYMYVMNEYEVYYPMDDD